MSFRAIYSGTLRQRVERLLIEAKSVGFVGPIKEALLQLHEIMERDPIGLGEPLYRLKHADLTVYAVVRRYLAVNYAVDEDRKLAYVMRFSLSGKHPYPPRFEEILDPKKT
jgi:hypothetical protein